MGSEPWPVEKALGSIGAIAAVVLVGLAYLDGPTRMCTGSAPATGLCTLPWAYQTANSDRTAAYAVLAFFVLLAGSLLILRNAPQPVDPRSLPAAQRRLIVAMVGLALLGVALFGACVAMGYSAPPSQTTTFSDAQLADVGNLYTPYYGISRAATVYLAAGEAIAANYSITWIASGSSTPQTWIGTDAVIQPAGEPLDYFSPFAYWYVVPRTGSYTIWFFTEYPGYAANWTSNSTLTVTAYILGYPPLAQSVLGALGSAAFAAAAVVDMAVHPRWRILRPKRQAEDLRPPVVAPEDETRRP